MAHRTRLLATVTSGVLFGTSVPVIKLGLSSPSLIPPFLFAALRFLTASILVAIFLRKSGWVKGDVLLSKQMWFVAILNAGGYILQFEGQVLASSSDAALIIGSAALMIPVIARVRGTEMLIWERSVGVLLGFFGAGLVVSRGEALSLGQTQLLGDLLILGTAVTIAFIFVFSKNLVDLKGSRAVTGGILLTTSALLLPFTTFDLGMPLNLGFDSWFYILFLSTFSTVGAYYFFAKGLETVSATVSSIILPIEVVVSVALSVIIFRDPFNLFSGTGALLIIAGVILVSYSPKQLQ